MDKKTKITIFFSILLIVVMSIFIQSLDDYAFNVARFMGIADNLKNGVLYPFPSYFSQFENAGYAAPLFYGDLFLLPTGLIYFFTENIILTSVFNMIYILTSCYFSMFFVLSKISKDDSKINPALCSLIYITAPELLHRCFINNSYGFCFAMIWAPLCLYYFYQCIKSESFDKRKSIIFALVMSCLFLSHMISTILLILLFACYFLYLCIKKQMDKNKFLTILLASVFFLGITSYFWIPMIEQILNYNVRMFIDDGNNLLTYTLSETSLSISEMVMREMLLYKYVIHILPILIIMLRLAYRNENIKNYDKLFIFILFFLFFQTDYFPLETIEPIFNFMQFVHRVYIFLLPLEILYIFLIFKNNLKIRIPIILLQVVCIVIFLITNITYLKERSVIDSDYSRYVTLVLEQNKKDGICGENDIHCHDNNSPAIYGMGEYLPAEFDVQYYINTDFENKYNYILERGYTKLVLRPDSGGVVELPIIYQYGYQAYQNNKELDVEVSKNGLLQLTISSQQPVYVYYQRTKIQIISIIISIISLISAVFISKKSTKSQKIDSNYSL